AKSEEAAVAAAEAHKPPLKPANIAIIVLGGLLAVSAIINIILAFSR
ncbi:unnamed protein product, partial [marine sediment metagenome]